MHAHHKKDFGFDTCGKKPSATRWYISDAFVHSCDHLESGLLILGVSDT